MLISFIYILMFSVHLSVIFAHTKKLLDFAVDGRVVENAMPIREDLPCPETLYWIPTSGDCDQRQLIS